MTEQERAIIKEELYVLCVGLFPCMGPGEVYNCVKKYVELRKELATDEGKKSVEMNPIFDELELAINLLPNEWQRAFWLSEQERYKREAYAPPKISFPPLPGVRSGI